MISNSRATRLTPAAGSTSMSLPFATPSSHVSTAQPSSPGAEARRPDTRFDRVARQRLREIRSALKTRLRRLDALQFHSAEQTAAALLRSPGQRSGAGSIEERFIQRTSFGWNVAVQQQVEAVGWRNVLEQQLEPESIDDGGLEEILLEVLPSLSMTPLQRIETYGNDLRGIPIIELGLAVFVRALFSPRQLLERTVELWNDHLHTSLEADFGPYFKADNDFAIRDATFGSFRRLLGASAHSPAMLDYLTNNTNERGHPNENYARELLELHTLGVDNGYTQQDVVDVARAFTGWTFFDPRDGYQSFGRFHFVRPLHDRQPKTVLGEQLPGGRGPEDGEQVLDILARHPNTARFVARKVLVHFWGERPSERQIDRLARVWSDTNGDLRQVVRAALNWYDLTTAPPKLKRPFHFLVSALRALFTEADAEPALVWLFEAGHFPFWWGPPNGYPDSTAYWSGAPIQRWNFATGTLFDAGGARLDHPAFAQFDGPEALPTVLDALLFGGSMSSTTRSALSTYLAERPWNDATRAEATALALASQDFQYF